MDEHITLDELSKANDLGYLNTKGKDELIRLMKEE